MYKHKNQHAKMHVYENDMFQSYSLHQNKIYTCGKANYSKTGWTKGKAGVAHALLSIWTSSVLSTRLDKSVYFLLVENVHRCIEQEIIFMI